MLTRQVIRTAVEAALEEDAPNGDITCETTIPAEVHGTARLVSRQEGVMSGIAVFEAAIRRAEPHDSCARHHQRWRTFRSWTDACRSRRLCARPAHSGTCGVELRATYVRHCHHDGGLRQSGGRSRRNYGLSKAAHLCAHPYRGHAQDDSGTASVRKVRRHLRWRT